MHFSRKCDGCRPLRGCSRCGDPGHAQRGYPVGPAFGMEGGARAAFLKAFARSKSSYGKIVAAGEVDEKSLGDLDRGLAKKLEFKCSIRLAKLKNWNLGPATNDERASNERTDQVTLASPPVIWSNVAVVTPVNVEKGPPFLVGVTLMPVGRPQVEGGHHQEGVPTIAVRALWMS